MAWMTVIHPEDGQQKVARSPPCGVGAGVCRGLGRTVVARRDGGFLRLGFTLSGPRSGPFGVRRVFHGRVTQIRQPDTRLEVRSGSVPVSLVLTLGHGHGRAGTCTDFCTGGGASLCPDPGTRSRASKVVWHSWLLVQRLPACARTCSDLVWVRTCPPVGCCPAWCRSVRTLVRTGT